MKSLSEYLNEGMGNHKLSEDPKDVNAVVTPAEDYNGVPGVIIGGLWNSKKTSDMHKAESLVKSMGLKVNFDIDALKDNPQVEKMWDNGQDFVYFYSPEDDQVNAYAFGYDGVAVLK